MVTLTFEAIGDRVGADISRPAAELDAPPTPAYYHPVSSRVASLPRGLAQLGEVTYSFNGTIPWRFDGDIHVLKRFSAEVTEEVSRLVSKWIGAQADMFAVLEKASGWLTSTIVNGGLSSEPKRDERGIVVGKTHTLAFEAFVPAGVVSSGRVGDLLADMSRALGDRMVPGTLVSCTNRGLR